MIKECKIYLNFCKASNKKVSSKADMTSEVSILEWFDSSGKTNKEYGVNQAKYIHVYVYLTHLLIYYP